MAIFGDMLQYFPWTSSFLVHKSPYNIVNFPELWTAYSILEIISWDIFSILDSLFKHILFHLVYLFFLHRVY